MTRLRFLAIPSETTSDFRAGSNDASGQPSERQISDGSGHPRRHCLEDIRQGEPFLIRGYGNDGRNIYGTGQIVATANLSETAANLLERPQVAYIHVRSASNNCYQCRIERG